MQQRSMPRRLITQLRSSSCLAFGGNMRLAVALLAADVEEELLRSSRISTGDAAATTLVPAFAGGAGRVSPRTLVAKAALSISLT